MRGLGGCARSSKQTGLRCDNSDKYSENQRKWSPLPRDFCGKAHKLGLREHYPAWNYQGSRDPNNRERLARISETGIFSGCFLSGTARRYSFSSSSGPGRLWIFAVPTRVCSQN